MRKTTADRAEWTLPLIDRARTRLRTIDPRGGIDASEALDKLDRARVKLNGGPGPTDRLNAGALLADAYALSFPIAHDDRVRLARLDIREALCQLIA